jgi:hypothetical protein
MSLLTRRFHFWAKGVTNTFLLLGETVDRLCGTVVRVPGYGARGPDSILGFTRFSEN